MSDPSDRVLGTPPTNTPVQTPTDSSSAGETGLAIQQRERETTLHDLARLRKEAFDQIEQLIGFIDSTDEYVTSELEDEDIDEPFEHDEPSLGFLDHVTDQTRICEGGGHNRWDILDREGEHDGAEPDEADYEPSAGYDGGEMDTADDEPSLGWGADGELGNDSGADREAGAAVVPPQDRTAIPGADQVRVEVSYRKFLHGLPPKQREMVKSRMGDDSGISLVGGPAWGARG